MADSEYDKWQEQQKKENNGFSKITKNLKVTHIIIFFIIIAIGWWAISTGKIQPSFFVGAVVAITVAVLFFLYKQPGERKEIPEHILKEIVLRRLEEKKKTKELPSNAIIRVLPANTYMYRSDYVTGFEGATYRDIGFEMFVNHKRTVGVVGIDIFTGMIGGIRWELFGFSGKGNYSHVKIVPVNAINVPDNTQDAKPK